MSQSKKAALFLIVAILLGFSMAVLATSCADTAEPSAETVAAADEEPQSDVPEKVLAARDAVLDFLRINAIALIPPKGAAWQTHPGGDKVPTGFDVYRFTSDTTTITVSYSEPIQEETLYNVSLITEAIGFCWQAVVDSNGQVVKTGNAAQIEPGPGNPAALYCEAQGHTYEIRILEDGKQCGACVFSEDSACNGWDYFFGDCGPDE